MRQPRRIPKRKFGILYDKLQRQDVLQAAWQKVKSNVGSAGVDRQTIEQIELRAWNASGGNTSRTDPVILSELKLTDVELLIHYY